MDSEKPGSDGWAQTFHQKFGRPPRVLHLGNVANNAYINAHILNGRGYDCDVLCYDYYHIMSCPEWVMGNFKIEELDQIRPDWSKKRIANFKRPPWFVQGPIYICSEYLLSKRKGMRLWKWLCWRALANYNNTLNTKTVIDWFVIRIFSLTQWWRHPGPPPPDAHTWPNKLRKAAGKAVIALFRLDPNEMKSEFDFSHRERELIEEFEKKFPNRADKLRTDDLAPYKERITMLRSVFKYYDLVVGYSTDALLPMAAGFKNYIAFEHGTIREIPFIQDAQGRLCALSYAMAGSIIMTNADSIAQARTLQPDHSRTIFGIHGFSEELIRYQLANSKKSRSELRFGYPDNICLFLAPARHDWSIKGNDKIIHAAKIVHTKVGNKFKIVFAKWGFDIERSQNLVRELGLDECCLWVPPLGKIDLIASSASADGVIDQFVVPCMGGITFESMAVGVPVITKLDDSISKDFFGEAIPLFNCTNAHEIANAIETVVTNPSIARAKADECTRWMNLHHSSDKLTEVHALAYEMVLRS